MAGGMRVLRSRRRGAWLLLAGACLASLAWLTVAHRNGGARPQGAIPAGLRYVHAPAWSANGRRAAVLARSEDRRFGLVLGTSSVQPRVVRCLALPDDLRIHMALDGAGTRLFYVAGSDEELRIWSAPVAGGRRREVARGVWPRPSPVNDDLVYYPLTDSGPAAYDRWNIWVVHGNGASRPVSPTLDFVSHVAWSPDGKRIAYVGHQWTADAGAAGGYHLLGLAVGVALAGGSDPEEVILATSTPTEPKGAQWAEYRWVGWADDDTVVVGVVRDDAGGRPVFAIDSYGLKTGARRELLPFNPDHVLVKYGHPETARGAKRVFWQVPPDEAATFRWVDLVTGRSAAIQFPEQVAPALSPEGSRILAVGLETGNLYFARLADADGRWRVERQHLR
jgi:hypothetical protein